MTHVTSARPQGTINIRVCCSNTGQMITACPQRKIYCSLQQRRLSQLFFSESFHRTSPLHQILRSAHLPNPTLTPDHMVFKRKKKSQSNQTKMWEALQKTRCESDSCRGLRGCDGCKWMILKNKQRLKDIISICSKSNSLNFQIH